MGLFTHLNVDIQQVPIQSPTQQLIAKLLQFEAAFIYPFSDDEEFVFA